MENLKYYNAFRSVPQEAQKPIKAGRLSGMTDINPMWRLKVLTEQFGPCGEGWKTELVNLRQEPAADGVIIATVIINLYVKYGDEWSAPILGIGGSSLVAKESKGLYSDDEAYKKAYTDAISVACKSLGVGADIYFQKDRTKYDTPQEDNRPKNELKCPVCGSNVKDCKKADGTITPAKKVLESCGMCYECYKKQKNES